MSQYQRATPTKRLSVPITATATSLTVNNILDWDSNSWTTGSFGLSTNYPVVLRNEANTQYELVEVDTTTLVGNTMDITKRALGYDGGTTAGTETAYSWNANETLVEFGTNPPQLYEKYIDKYDAETIAGVKTFTSLPSIPTTPVSSSDAASKAYVDAAGLTSPNYQSQVISGNASTSYSLGSVVYYSSSDQYWYPTDADNTTSFQYKTLGITQSTCNTSGVPINILIKGASTSISTSMTAGTKYYMANTTGAMGTTGTYEVYLGYALSSTKFLFEPRADHIPFSNQQYALIGFAISTAAVPSSSNPYLTKFDTTSAVTTGCLIPLRNATGDIIVNITPQTSGAAASKAYVDTLGDAVNYSVNTVQSTATTYYTWSVPAPWSSSIVGWNFYNWSSGNVIGTMMGNVYKMNTTGYAGMYNASFVKETTAGGLVKWQGINNVKIKQMFKPLQGVTTSANELWGFGLDSGPGSSSDQIFTTTNSVNGSRMCFMFEATSNALKTVTCSTDSGVTANVIATFTAANFAQNNVYEIDYRVSSSVVFSVNGSIVATHVSNLPTTSNSNDPYYVMACWSTDTNQGLFTSPITVSYQL